MVELTNTLEQENGTTVVEALFSMTAKLMSQTKLNARLSMTEKDMNTNGFFLILNFQKSILYY